MAVDNVSLIPFSEKFLTEDYVAWLNDPDVMRYSENRHRIHDLASCRAYFEFMLAVENPFWAICDETGIHVGNLSAYIDSPNKVADLAIMLGPKSARGKGLGLRAWKAAMSALFNDYGMRKIEAGTMSLNVPMRRIFERSGMRIEGRRTGRFLLDGQPVSAILAGILRKDFYP